MLIVNLWTTDPTILEAQFTAKVLSRTITEKQRFYQIFNQFDFTAVSNLYSALAYNKSVISALTSICYKNMLMNGNWKLVHIESKVTFKNKHVFNVVTA